MTKCEKEHVYFVMLFVCLCSSSNFKQMHSCFNRKHFTIQIFGIFETLSMPT